jgi:lipopolysaccharide export system permease protein
MARRHATLHAYIAREFLLSFIVAFLFFFFIFFVNNILLLAEDVLSKNVPLKDVILLVIYTLPSVVSISFPFASLVGALMAVGRFSSRNEILSFQASGIPRRTIFTPFIFLGIIFTFVSFIMNDYFIPVGNINFGKLYRKVLLSNPELELESISVKRYQNAVIITGEVSGNNISDLIIIDETPEKNRRIIAAQSALLAENIDQRGVISLELQNVFSHIPDAKVKKEFEYFQSKKMIYNILLSDISFSISNPSPREMSSLDVYHALTEKKDQQNLKEFEHQRSVESTAFDFTQKYRATFENLRPGTGPATQFSRALKNSHTNLMSLVGKEFKDRTIHMYELEFYKKFSLPFGCMAFVFFAFPVGLFAKRSGRSVGFGIGLFVSIVYWGMLFAGQTFGFRLNFSPILSMWLPNIVIVSIGIIFFIIRRRR